MSFAFNSVKKITIPEGTVKQITRASDNVVLWEKIKELAYYGSATPLSVRRYDLAATTVGNYALFGGGDGDDGISADVDAYNTSLTRSIPTALSEERHSLAATTVGNYALFGGGTIYNDASYTVDAYNNSLTRSIATKLTNRTESLAATTVGNYALFGGGHDPDFTTVNSVDVYNASLTKTTATGLIMARRALAATTVGNYAVFAGGADALYTTNYGNVDAYDTSLTRSTPTVLSKARHRLAATTVGNYALFGGGSDKPYTPYDVSYDAGYDTVDAYNTSLTRSTATNLSTGRHSLAATTVGNYALFGGGAGKYKRYYEYHIGVTDIVDAYDTSLTRTTASELSYSRNRLAAATVGDYALFGGGHNPSDGGGDAYEVDAYTVADTVA